MKYWVQPEVPGWELVAKQLTEYSRPWQFHKRPFWNTLELPVLRDVSPELFTGTAHLGEIRHVALLVLIRDTSTLHTDHTVGHQKGVLARLNLPIRNTEGSVTKFYDREVLGEHTLVDQYGTKVWEPRERFQPVTQVAVTRPTILRISEPHSVFCETNKFPRLTLTVTFTEDASRWLV